VDRSRWVGIAIAAALFGLAFVVKLPLVGTEPYGDENQHFVTAADPRDPTPGYSDVWGNPLGSPPFLFFQRPAYYTLFHFPASMGFEAYRITHALTTSLLAPLGYWLLRAHGVTRPAAGLAGAALAVTPPLVLYGAYAFMDVLMTTALLGMAIAYKAQRWPLVAGLALLAVWIKEIALAAVLVLFLVAFVRAWLRGRASLYPLRLEAREASLAWPLVVGPLPLAWAFSQGLLPPGGVAYGTSAEILELLLPTVWLLPIIAAGLWTARSRTLSTTSLAIVAAFTALHAAGRSVEAWYAVPSVIFAILAAAASADGLIAHACAKGIGRRLASTIPAAVAILGCFAFAFQPSGAAREALFPLTGEERSNLQQTYDFEQDLRGKDIEGALDEIPFETEPDVLFVQNLWPWPFVRLEVARHVYADYPGIRMMFGLDTDALAHRLENATTWTILGPGEYALQPAIREVYADCLVAAHGGWHVYYGAPCAGRADELAAANVRHGGA
jgi:hypothetical protein